MRRRYAAYTPASRWRRLRRVQLFRSVQLNVAGWSAIVVLCVAGSGVGYAGSRLFGLPTGLGLAAGSLTVMAVLIGLDRRRWARLLHPRAPER